MPTTLLEPWAWDDGEALLEASGVAVLEEWEPSDAHPPPHEGGEEVRSVGGSGAELEASDDEELGGIDPCSLLPLGKVEEWIGPGVRQTELEAGVACGYRNDADHRRVAVAVLEVGGGRWLTPADHQHAQPVDSLGAPAWWLASWPLPQTSMLVVELPSHDLVVEVSARDGADASRIRATAEALALDALEVVT